tara:strand:- start:352 stop:573 length:222 start_codon:yes stop_codon:yes gene_type:complete
MSDKKMFKFIGCDDLRTPIITDEIESRGYKKAVKSFQNKFPKLKIIMVQWFKNKKLQHKVQKLPMGRKKKLGG